MARLLSNDELKDILKADYSSKTINKDALERRKHNIQAFNKIDRHGLEYDKKEKRILLYETMNKEKIFMQFPGKEAVENPAMPLDFRPKVELQNGEFAVDLSFGAIWDILDGIGKKHKAYLSYVAAVVFRLSYLHDYNKVNSEFSAFELEINNGIVFDVLEVEKERLEWYCMNLPEDIWYTLNDKIGMIDLGNNQKISFEGFAKLVDLLFQNEDCKYYYKNVIIKGNENYKYDNGRNNSGAANLLILNYLEGNVKLSRLLDAFQKSRGVPSLRKSDYSMVTNGMVINIDMEERSD